MPILNLEVIHCCHSIKLYLLFFDGIVLHELMNLLGHLKTVHLRHVDICEYKLEHLPPPVLINSLGELVNAFLPAERCLRLQPELHLEH